MLVQVPESLVPIQLPFGPEPSPTSLPPPFQFVYAVGTFTRTWKPTLTDNTLASIPVTVLWLSDTVVMLIRSWIGS